MIYSENLTNRELVLNALPLISLSKTQWVNLLKHLETIERESGKDSSLYKTIEILHNNQARLEIMNFISSYCENEIDEPLEEKSEEMITIGF